VRLRREMEIPKPKSIIVWGILVLEENNAAAKTIAKNIGIIYSRVRAFPAPLKTVTVLLVEEEEEGIAAVAAASIIAVIVSAIIGIAILIL
jgi:O-acetylhomoserine/O-acetylserine sulfhydrylase-like pyridoxal-dependent enzyme